MRNIPVPHPSGDLRSSKFIPDKFVTGSLHRTLVKRKYRLLLTPKRRGKPGPKGPSSELIAAIIEMKRNNPRCGCRRIAEQISFVFGVEIDKDVVRRVLAKYYHPGPRNLSTTLRH